MCGSGVFFWVVSSYQLQPPKWACWHHYQCQLKDRPFSFLKAMVLYNIINMQNSAHNYLWGCSWVPLLSVFFSFIMIYLIIMLSWKVKQFKALFRLWLHACPRVTSASIFISFTSNELLNLRETCYQGLFLFYCNSWVDFFPQSTEWIFCSWENYLAALVACWFQTEMEVEQRGVGGKHFYNDWQVASSWWSAGSCVKLDWGDEQKLASS